MIVAALSLLGCCGITGDYESGQPAGEATAAAPQYAFSISMYDTEDPVDSGGRTNYVIEAENMGPAADNAVLEFRLSGNLAISGASNNGRITGGTVIWDLGAVGAGEKLTRTVEARALGAGTGEALATIKIGNYAESNAEGTAVYG